jgi:hypothetical protein
MRAMQKQKVDGRSGNLADDLVFSRSLFARLILIRTPKKI